MKNLIGKNIDVPSRRKDEPRRLGRQRKCPKCTQFLNEKAVQATEYKAAEHVYEKIDKTFAHRRIWKREDSTGFRQEERAESEAGRAKEQAEKEKKAAEKRAAIDARKEKKRLRVRARRKLSKRRPKDWKERIKAEEERRKYMNNWNNKPPTESEVPKPVPKPVPRPVPPPEKKEETDSENDDIERPMRWTMILDPKSATFKNRVMHAVKRKVVKPRLGSRERLPVCHRHFHLFEKSKDPLDIEREEFMTKSNPRAHSAKHEAYESKASLLEYHEYLSQLH